MPPCKRARIADSAPAPATRYNLRWRPPISQATGWHTALPELLLHTVAFLAGWQPNRARTNWRASSWDSLYYSQLQLLGCLSSVCARWRSVVYREGDSSGSPVDFWMTNASVDFFRRSTTVDMVGLVRPARCLIGAMSCFRPMRYLILRLTDSLPLLPPDSLRLPCDFSLNCCAYARRTAVDLSPSRLDSAGMAVSALLWLALCLPLLLAYWVIRSLRLRPHSAVRSFLPLSASSASPASSCAAPSGRRVLVVGGSFAGLTFCHELLHRLPATHSDVAVLLVEPRQWFEYTPGVLRALVRPSHHRSLLTPIAHTRAGSDERVERLQGAHQTARHNHCTARSDGTRRAEHRTCRTERACAGCSASALRRPQLDCGAKHFCPHLVVRGQCGVHLFGAECV